MIGCVDERVGEGGGGGPGFDQHDLLMKGEIYPIAVAPV